MADESYYVVHADVEMPKYEISKRRYFILKGI